MEFGMFCEFPVRSGLGEAEAFAEGMDLVDDAERLGLDAVWLSESHVAPGGSMLASPIVVASAIAGRTTSMKIGLAVQVLPLGNPLRIAEEGATVDQLSRGRLIFGVGRSGSPRAYDAYGIPYSESSERFAETLEIILKAWTEPSFSYEGRWYSYRDVGLTPKPYRQPHPEVRVAVNSAPSFERFGRQGFPIFVGIRQGGVSQMLPHVQAYRAAYRAAGHTGDGGVFLRVPVYVAETAEQALSEPEPSIVEYFQNRGVLSSKQSTQAGGPAVSDRTDGAEGPSPIGWDELLEERVIAGTPRRVTARLRELLGLDGILAEVNSGGKIPPLLVKRSLRLLCEEVMPAFQTRR